MTPDELIPIIRSEYLDELLDEEECEEVQELTAKNKTHFLLREINRAQRQACWRGDLRKIHEDGTNGIDTITFVAGQRAYPLNRNILLVDSATLDGRLLRKASERLLDDWNRYCNWRTQKPGCPRNYYIKGRTLYLDRKPDHANAGRQLVLDVWRTPLKDARVRDQLEIEEDAEALGHWVAHRAFLRPNSDMFDQGLAQYHLSAFTEHYGQFVPQNIRLEMLEAPPAVNFGRSDLKRWPILDRSGYGRGRYELFGDCGDY